MVSYLALFLEKHQSEATNYAGFLDVILALEGLAKLPIAGDYMP